MFVAENRSALKTYPLEYLISSKFETLISTFYQIRKKSA